MSEQIEYKRVTKDNLLQLSIVYAVAIVISGFMFNSILVSIWIAVYEISRILFEYSLDKKFKLFVSVPIYVLVLAGLFTSMFFFLETLFRPLIIRLILVIGMLVFDVFVLIKAIGNPPYVHDGKYYIEDKEKYGRKMIKRLFLFLAILVVLPIVLYIILTIWKNSLL